MNDYEERESVTNKSESGPQTYCKISYTITAPGEIYQKSHRFILERHSFLEEEFRYWDYRLNL